MISNKIKHHFLLLLLCMPVFASAMPAWRGEMEKTLPDGTRIMVTMQGDRYFHYLTSADGRWWKETADGTLQQIQPLSDNDVLKRRMARRRTKQNINTATPLNIAPRGLVILANFTDHTFKADNTQEAFQEMLNGDNYTYNGATGSARQYFIDQSMGKYMPEFDVVGPVNLTHNTAYYGKDLIYDGEEYEGEDERAVDMIVEACQLADTDFGVDFTKYDCDNDGEVDFVFVIYAGFSQAESGVSSYIWPHAFWVSDFHGEEAGGVTCILDGKKINTYACGSELKGSSGSTRSGIGTFCHEFSHVLGLPDLYITQNEDATHRTMGSWDILDYGPYNNSGRTPPAYSAYERFFCGWLTPTILNTAGTYSLEDIKTSNAAAIITSTGRSNLQGNDPDPTEFFLLENRQQAGWDAPLKGHGLMITKIKYNYDNWYNNIVNDDPKNMGVDLIEAKTNNTSIDRKTDLYPAGATAYTPYTQYPITNIEETDGVITFNFMGGGDSIVITLLETVEAEEHTTAVYDIFGNKISTTDINTLPRGIYIVKTPKTVRKIFVQ